MSARTETAVQADLVLVNGEIVTMDGVGRVAEAITLSGEVLDGVERELPDAE